ncbi:MAG TPA: AMP-binding protein, partial [bacterium]|nr:AMP-binding protein [bacterium]
LSFLPMSHALGRASAIAYFHAGVLNYIGESLDTVAEDFRLARPTVAFTVPRVFEKAYEKIRAQAGGSPVKRRLFEWALSLARRVQAERDAGREPGPLLRARAAAADRVVFSKIRARLGGRIRVLWSGGASLAAHLADFYQLVGIPIRDVYGMSEFGLSHMTPAGRVRPGSCGLTTPGFEVRIADDGEILVRAQHGMLRYHGLDEDTAAFREPDGWMHTGDIGRLDEEGWLWITDRKKSLIVLSNGKKVAPAPIEQKLVESEPLLAQAVVIGEGRNYLVALLSPNAELAASRGLDAAAVEEALRAAVDAVNRDLPSFETIKQIGLLPAPLTEEGGELTPTLKVKRAEVAKKHAALIESLYRTDAAPRKLAS